VVTLQGYSGRAWRPRSPIIATLPLRILGGLVAAVLLGMAGPTSRPVVSGDYASDVLRSSGAERGAQHLVPLLRSACLSELAEQQARQMAQRERLYHQELETVLHTCRLNVVGENVAVGFVSGAAATQGWVASPDHRANLLEPAHTQVGVGASRDAHGRWYVSQLLAAGAQDDQQGNEPFRRDLVPSLRGGA